METSDVPDEERGAFGPQPLAGLRVVDLSRVLAGPLCTMILGDLGADVIKVERPGVGDDTRTWGPPFVDGEAAYFLSLNRNKRSVTVDLSSEEGRSDDPDAHRRRRRRDRELPPGVMESFGLGLDALREEHPRLVTCTLTAFGEIRGDATRFTTSSCRRCRG
jgi:crotonobetainyl-CoA:carnitine CoA-transferase CaiB-like acyl-CoA transferase